MPPFPVDLVSKKSDDNNVDVENATAASDKAVSNLVALFQKSSLGHQLKTDLEAYHKMTETSIKNNEVTTAFKGKSHLFFISINFLTINVKGCMQITSFGNSIFYRIAIL